MPSRTYLPALGLAAAACVHPGPAVNGPEDVARRYAQALEEGRVDDAWALSAPLDREAFARRYADPTARATRAREVHAAASGDPPGAIALEAHQGRWRVAEGSNPAASSADEEAARALIVRWLAAIDRGDFADALTELGQSWRARYTAERLEADLLAEPLAKERLARIRAAVGGKWELTREGPELPLGEGRRLRLRREGERLKVVALE